MTKTHPLPTVLALIGLGLNALLANAGHDTTVRDPLPPNATGQASLTGEISDSIHSTFIPGQAVRLQFRMPGLPEDTKEILSVHIVDEHGRPVRDGRFPLVATTNADVRIRYSDDLNNGIRLWKADVRAPTNRLGFFQVFATLSNGVELEPLVRRGRYLTYAIVPDPFQRVQVARTEAFFGLVDIDATLAPLLGAHGERLGYNKGNWAYFEPDRTGQFKEQLAAHQDRLSDLIAPLTTVTTNELAGKALPWARYHCLCVCRPPHWATRPETRAQPTARYQNGSLTPDGEKAWRSFCTELVGAYAKAYPGEDRPCFEITTEPDSGWGFNGTPAELVRIHQIAYEAIHAANPDAWVAGPTLSQMGEGYDWDVVEAHSRLFKAGLGQWIDVLHLHSFQGPPEDGQFIQKIRAIRQITRATCGRDIPMASTEAGTSYRGETREHWLDKARADIRTSLIMLGEGFLYNNAFQQDSTRSPDVATSGYYLNLDPSRDYEPARICPAPVAPAYAAMSFLLEGHQTAGAIEWLGNTAWGYAYQHGNDIVLAIWDWSGTPRAASIPVGTAAVSVYDWMGNATTVPCPDGILPITLTREPQYVRGVSPALWSRTAGKPIVLKESSINVYPGQELSLSLTLTDVGGKGWTGRLLNSGQPALGIAPESSALSLPAGTHTQLTFKAIIPAATAAGAFPLTVLLTQTGMPCAAAGCLVNVLAPGHITRITPDLTTNGPAIRVRLSADIAVHEGMVSASVATGPDPFRGTPQTVTLAAGEEKEFGLEFPGFSPDPGTMHDVTVSMVTREGSRQDTVKRLNFFGAVQRGAPLTVDGALTEWSNARPVTISAPAALRVPASLYGGPGDLAVETRLGWDPTALHLSFDVTDDAHVQTQDDSTTWMEDSIQLGINLDPDSVRTSRQTGTTCRWQELTLSLTPRGAEVFRTMSYDPHAHPNGLLCPGDAALAVKRSGGHTICELAIPWKTLGAETPFRAGDRLGFACTIKDKDPGDSNPLVLGLFNGIYGGKDIAQFGWVVLERNPDEP